MSCRNPIGRALYNDRDLPILVFRGRESQVAIEDKYDRVKRLMEVGKERGYVLYDEVSDVLPTDLNGGGDLDDVLAGFDGAGIEILEDAKPEFDKKLEDGEDVLDLELPPGIG